MILTAHQPAYFPWLGYFEKIARSDVFVFLDTVQFEKNSFINRNKIKTPQGSHWLTIPVKIKGHMSSTLLEIEVDDRQAWRKKHLRSIEMNYKKAPFFAHCFPMIQKLLSYESNSLVEICFHHLQFWLTEFGIQTKVIRSSETEITSKKSNLIFDLCKRFSINTYYSGALGKDYLDENVFLEAGIKIIYQNFNHPTYFQFSGDFEAGLGIVDYWMNCGPGKIPFLKETYDGI